MTFRCTSCLATFANPEIDVATTMQLYCPECESFAITKTTSPDFDDERAEARMREIREGVPYGTYQDRVEVAYSQPGFLTRRQA